MSAAAVISAAPTLVNVAKPIAAMPTAQSLSTPLSFFEFQQQHSAETAASPVDAEQGQIVAASVTVDDISAAPQAEFVVVRCASGSSAKVALVDRDANLFVVSDCLIAISAIAQGQPLSLNRNCLVAALFKALPAEEQAPLLRYTSIELRSKLSAIPITQPGLEVKRLEGMGHTLATKAAFKKGDVLYHFPTAEMPCLPFATVYTICSLPGLHQIPVNGLECIAHECAPSAHIQVDPVSGDQIVVALKDLAAGDIVSFNYLSTEWLMDAPFDCCCGAAGCFGRIAGFSKQTEEKQQLLLEAGTVSPVVKALHEQQIKHQCSAEDAAVPFAVHQVHPIKRGNVISPKVWFSLSASAAYVRDGTSSFAMWAPSAANADAAGQQEAPNACLMPIAKEEDAWILQALTDIQPGQQVRVMPALKTMQN